jgi:hypothetical protein
MQESMMAMTNARPILAIALASILSGCLTPESFLKKTNAKLAGCLQVGMASQEADTCMHDARISFFPEISNGPARIYRTSAAGPWISASVVLFTLHFNQAGTFESWTSEVRSDAP